ncbi:MAG: hypothetical protein KDA60_07165 [Planctomycetales bacterium]|nr:hypothetical protein [Planctomycetales bacterium]
MTAQEIRGWLEQRPFLPFNVTTNDGCSYEVRHPELALIADSGALYAFRPAKMHVAHVAGLPTAIAIRNITTVAPIAL